MAEGLPTLADNPRPQRISGYVVANLIAGARYVSHRGAHFAAGKTWRAARLLLSFGSFIRLLRLLSHPQSAGLAREHPGLPFKYLGDYVALRLPMRVRRSILESHYRFLQQKFTVTFLDLVRRERPVLWQASLDGRSFHILIDFPERHYEGDLRLNFAMDGAELYRLIFVFAEGRDLNFEEGIILIMTSIQGDGDFSGIKLATKTCHDTQPAHILMAALSGLAESTGIATLFGFHETRQISRGDELFFSYERFFESYGKEITDTKMYQIRMPYFEKPVAEIKTNHRSRNLRKRQFKAEIRAQVKRAVEKYLN
jgi:uncharacterized protein VirK/YbjX